MKARDRDELLNVLEVRFAKNMHRHPGIAWRDVRNKLEGNPSALRSLHEMESTGGEPDVIGRDKEGRYRFCDCSAESPVGRRSVCYDREALESRKEHKPENSAVEMAAAMGIDLLTPRVGSTHHPTFGNSVERSSVIAAMARSSCTTTGRSRTTPQEASAGRFGSERRAEPLSDAQAMSLGDR
jgi:hypothetical protein